jgi:CBS domain containing-hemolysin-like protein
METARRSKHTRYPVCRGSLDNVLGFVHTKDLLLLPSNQEPDLKAICHPPRYVPETMPLSRLLGLFKASHQHMAFVVDEHGTVAGVVMLENLLERIVGKLQDEFDDEPPAIVPEGPNCFVIDGGVSIALVNKAAGTRLTGAGVDTLAGLVMEKSGRIVVAGDQVALDGATAEVLEVKHNRAVRIRLVVLPDRPDDASEKGA